MSKDLNIDIASVLSVAKDLNFQIDENQAIALIDEANKREWNDTEGWLSIIELLLYELYEDKQIKKHKTLDLTPKWSDLVTVFCAVLTDGKPEGRQPTINNFKHMAKVADDYVELSKKMPNGYHSFFETQYEIVMAMTKQLDRDGSRTQQAYEEGGRGRMYEMAEDLTIEFEKLQKGNDWSSDDFFDEIDKFIEDKV